MAEVLILDDETDLTELYRMALESGGHRVVGIYENPDDALSDHRRTPSPNVIILDERMNGRSGLAYLSRLRDAFPAARILFASADPDAVEASVLRCADAAKKKPFPLGDLVEEVCHLERSPAPAKKCLER